MSPAAKAPESAPEKTENDAAMEILRRLEKGLGANFEGEFFPSDGVFPDADRKRPGQEDQPSVAEHARRPDCIVGIFEVNFSGTMYNGVGYCTGPTGSKAKLGTPPPIARRGRGRKRGCHCHFSTWESFEPDHHES